MRVSWLSEVEKVEKEEREEEERAKGRRRVDQGDEGLSLYSQ